MPPRADRCPSGACCVAHRSAHKQRARREHGDPDVHDTLRNQSDSVAFFDILMHVRTHTNTNPATFKFIELPACPQTALRP
eukprot:938317-Lingulodinium_polyedra.AAC.1